MKMAMVLGFLLFSTTLFARAEYSVTGKFTGYNHSYDSCAEAAADAEDKAVRLCLREGGTGRWFGGEFGRCREVFIPGGSKIKLTFFCEMPRSDRGR